MDDSISKEEVIGHGETTDNQTFRTENVAVVDSGLTEAVVDTLGSVNVQGAVQNVQGVTLSKVEGSHGSSASDGDTKLVMTYPTDYDNGNLPEDEGEEAEKEYIDKETPDRPESEINSNLFKSSTPEIQIEAPPSTTVKETNSEEPTIKGLADVDADIPFADDGSAETERYDGGTEEGSDVKQVLNSDSVSAGTLSSDSVRDGLALPVPGVSGDVPQSSSSTSVSTDSGGSKRRDESPQSVYHIKWIMFKEKKVPIITQNENGPCPLLAIMNYLLLKEKIKLPPVMEIITADQLMEYLGDCVFEQVPKNVSEDAQLNIEQNVHDAMSVFHKLQTGLDVNVKFTGVADFEYTSECIIFDILGIPMFHGWLVDPQSPEVQAAIAHYSYNQLVEKIITQKSSDKPELVTEALIAESFLERTASQLTYHGLCELNISVKEEELGVLFRNNHFSTIYKHKNELFLLVTDQGFLTENNVVWETLSNVEGDGNFVDADFRTYRKPEVSTHTIPPPPVPAGSTQQVDQDYLVALSLQQEQQNPDEEAAQQPASQSPHQVQSDLQLAIQLQEEENRQAQAAAQHQRNNQQQLSQLQQEEAARRQQQQQEGRRKSGDCILL